MPNSENCTAAPAFFVSLPIYPWDLVLVLISLNTKRSGAVVQYLETLVLQRFRRADTSGAVPAQWCNQYVDC
jgi:hypothetical protein